MTADLAAALDRIEGLAAEADLPFWERPQRFVIPPDEMSDPTWLPRLAAVVRAVLGVHKPVQVRVIDNAECVAEECDHDGECPATGTLTICAGCDAMCEEAYAYYAESNIRATAWPCATVRAATKAWEDGR